MKKLIAILLVLCTIPFVAINVAAEEANIVDSKNSGFEGVTNLADIDWFTLVDSTGNSKNTSYKGLSVKLGDAHTGNSCLSLTASQSWYSPSINLYPFFKEAGAGKYVISYYVRCKEKTPTGYQVRALAADLAVGDEKNYFPAIEDRTSTGDGNYFKNHSGTLTEENNGWYYFESKVIEISATSLTTDHNWWFCLSGMLSTQYTVDIDDFCIRRATAQDSVTPTPTATPKPTPTPTTKPEGDEGDAGGSGTGSNVETNEFNCIDAINSNFEDANSIEDTKWFTLINSFGDSKSKSYAGLSLRAGSAHSGSKYISITADKSWYSPSINLHPFLKEAGAGEYVVTFYIRTKSKTPTSFLVRALQSDLPTEEEADYFPNITDRKNNNYFGSHPGSASLAGDWAYFVSEPFEVTASSLEKEHNWWFCIGEMSNTEWTVDIDDFMIIPAGDYVDPNDVPATDITYISNDMIDNAYKVEAPIKDLPPVINNGAVTVTNSNNDITLYICLGITVVALAVIAPVVLIKLTKKKK
jgi:hypothetical protein